MKSENLAPLAAEAKKGNQKALNDLIESCYNDIYYFALKTVKNEEVAADVTQDACLKIIQSLDKLNDPSAFKSWALRITYNFCAMHFRATKDILVGENEDGETVFDTLADDSEDAQPDKAYENAEFKQMMRDMIESLPAEQASALMLYYYEKASVKEISEIHGVSEGTVKSRLNYGRKAVKEKVEDYEKRTGIKLHSITPLPLLIYWFFAQNTEKMPAAAALALSSAPAAAAAGATAAGVAAAKAGISALIAKIIVSIIATGVVVGAVIGGVLISQNSDGSQTTAADTTVASDATSPTDTSSLLGGDTVSPDTTAPDTTVSETTTPDATVPDTTTPETTAPAPETTAPETTAPHTHVFGAWDVSEAPTCYAEGVEERSCACGVTETQAIPTVGHTETDVIGKDATCTEAGLTDGKKCTVCGTFTVEQTEIPATGHSYTDGACTVCGEPKTSEGLEFTLNDDGESYSVAGIGSCADTDVVIPATYEGKPVTGIGSDAFYDSSITSVNIPDGVTRIAPFAFANCSTLTSVSIPDSVTSIGEGAFYGCNSLQYTEYNNAKYLGNEENPHVVLYEVIDKNAAAFTISSNAKIIYESAFQYCFSLSDITLPEGITSIGRDAFENCQNLTGVSLPDGLLSIGSSAFGNCIKLASINIPDSVTFIDYAAFGGCSALKSVYITDIGAWLGIEYGYFAAGGGDYMTYSCNPCSNGADLYLNGQKLTDLVIPEGITEIGSNAFYGCTSITSITIPKSVRSIDSTAFFGCSSLASITVAQDNSAYHSAGNCLIETSSKTLVLGCASSTIPTDGSVTSIGYEAFAGCTSLNSITIPATVTDIYDAAFYGCSSLESITIPEGVASIGWNAFHSCTALTSVSIPKSVTAIGNYAFENCPKLKSVYITDIEAWCNISFEAYDPSEASTANPCYNGADLYLNGEKLTALVIPESVTAIADGAFCGCTSITSVTIHSGVTAIGCNAFYDCTALTSINYGGTMAEWEALEKGDAWDENTPVYTVHCSDGDIAK